MTIDTQHLDADGDKIKLARPALLDMAQRVNSLSSTSVTSIANLRLVDKTKFSRAFVLGYDTAGDGGGGVYWYDSADTTSTDNAGSIIVASDGGRWKLVIHDYLTTAQFGTKGDGSTDDTIDFPVGVLVANAPTSKRRYIRVPSGTYRVTQLVLNDLYDLHIHFDGVTLFGTASSAKDALLKLVNAYNVRFSGSLIIDCNGNTNYENGLMLDTATGGTIDPANGVMTRVSIEGLTVYNAVNALRIGTKTKDAQCSEIDFFGFNSIRCPGGVYLAGSQTGASFHGCNIMSETHASLPAAPQWALIMDGGFATINGGEIGHMVTSTNATIWMRPAVSATYSNPYPVLRLNGVHIETAAQLLILSNPDAVASPDGGLSEFTVSGCSGFVSNAPDALHFIDIADGLYTGTISVKQSKIYKASGAAARTGANINCYGAPTSVSVDRESFGRGFKNWMGGVVGGSLLHAPEDIISANNLNGVLYPAAATVLKFTSKLTGGQFDRYAAAYNTGTGVFTVPSGGLKTLRVAARCSAPGLAGDIFVRLNGAMVALGQIVGTAAFVETSLANLAAGATVEVVLQPTGSVTFGSAASDNIVFSASN